jgi:D-3-phosphoglycerate dehydrogenase
MTKVLVATEKPFATTALNGIRKIIEEAGFEFAALEKYTDPDDLLKAVSDADALIIRSDLVTREVLEAGKKLKIVVRAGAGYDNIDLKAATEKGIVVMNTPGQNANAVAELALAMMVYLARGCFNGKPGTELRGKTLGLHAYGHVGRRVAAIAKGFGMEVYAFDPYLKKEDITSDGVNYVETADDLYSGCQYVSLHIPATPDTIRSINFTLLSKMPKGATLVNTARKEIIDEESLLKIFSVRDDFRYIADVAPDCAGDIAKAFEGRYYFTPKKMGAQTAEANSNAGIAAANQIVNFIKKGDRTFQVN